MATKRIIAKPVTRLTLQQLVKMTPSAIVARASRQCHLVRKQYAVGSNDGFRRTYVKNPVLYNEMRTWTVCTDGKRNSYLRFFGPPELTTEVWCWCSCEYFKFHLEVCLARYNSSVIRSSNGMLPIIRNRRMIPHLCKHLLIAAKYAIQERKDLVNQRMEQRKKEQEQAAKRAAAARKEQLETRGKVIPKGRFTTPLWSGAGLVDIY